MISRLEGWTWDVRGGGVTLSPMRAGPSVGVISYRERVGPLRSIAEILRDKPDVDFKIKRVSPVTPLVTYEGEFAAIVDFEGVSMEMPVQRSLGFVFGDDWYSEIAAVVHNREYFAMFAGTVRELVRGDRLMLGVRRRRYSYTPPAGWDGYSRLPMFATWFPPEYPKSPTSITIYPAIPTTEQDVRIAHLRLGPVAPADVHGEVSPRNDWQLENGLLGATWDFAIRDEAGRDLIRRLVMLRDERYIYACHLDARHDHLEGLIPTWKDLVGSIQPLPATKPADAVNKLFEHLY
jgi:hypothetical protein